MVGYRIDVALVALHGGAWIETEKMRELGARVNVALHGGAWIETINAAVNACYRKLVALHGGAWIETSICQYT